MDRSASAADVLESAAGEIERLLESNKGAQDRIFYVDFAAGPVLRGEANSLNPAARETRLRLATEFALARRHNDRRHPLARGDGWLEHREPGWPAGTFAGGPRAAGSPGCSRRKPAEDFRIENLTMPERVRPGEGFLIEAQAAGFQRRGDVRYEIISDGKKAGEGVLNFRGGRAHLRVAARATLPGARKYEVRLLPEDDSRPGNNVAARWVEVSEGQSVLLITAYEGDPHGRRSCGPTA